LVAVLADSAVVVSMPEPVAILAAVQVDWAVALVDSEEDEVNLVPVDWAVVRVDSEADEVDLVPAEVWPVAAVLLVIEVQVLVEERAASVARPVAQMPVPVVPVVGCRVIVLAIISQVVPPIAASSTVSWACPPMEACTA
jgi:hypothetical protein